MKLPNPRQSLVEDFIKIGLKPGMTLMVHCSLSKVGWTVGGAETVIRALIDVLQASGTLVMPAESPQISDPSDWNDDRVNPQWHEIIREHLPVFDPLTTPTTMGAVAEAFRNYPGTIRSNHPLVSVCANGQYAQEITDHHCLPFCEGQGSPFEKLYTLDSWTLLLGVGFNRCTSLHYAESLVPTRRTTVSRFPIIQDGQRIWMEQPDMAADNGQHFPVVEGQFRETGLVFSHKVGQADVMLFQTRSLVDFAEHYFKQNLKPA